MTRTIKEGDKVQACWINEGDLKGTVMHVPEFAGDLWFIRSEDGRTDHAINPSSSEFDCIVKANPTDKARAMGEGDDEH